MAAARDFYPSCRYKRYIASAVATPPVVTVTKFLFPFFLSGREREEESNYRGQRRGTRVISREFSEDSEA